MLFLFLCYEKIFGTYGFGLCLCCFDGARFPLVACWQVGDLFGNETMYFDNMEILQEGGMVVLKMSAEKGGKRFVGSFVGTKLCNDLWAFVCAEADSPSAIYYRNLGDGQVYVWTEVKTSLDVCTDFIMYKRK